jgi:hypothetical protein
VPQEVTTYGALSLLVVAPDAGAGLSGYQGASLIAVRFSAAALEGMVNELLQVADTGNATSPDQALRILQARIELTRALRNRADSRQGTRFGL